MKRRIVFLGPVHPYRGGIASFSERLANEFIKEGWDVKCITFTFQYPKLFFPGKNQYSEEEKPNLDIDRVIHSLNPLSWRKALKAIKSFEPSIVICPHWNPLMSWSSTWLLNRLSCKKVILVHNLYPHESKFYDKYFVNRLLKVNGQFLAISSSVFRKIQSAFPDVLVTNHQHPIYDHYGQLTSKSDAAKTLELDSNKDYLLFFGLVRPYKGLSLLLHALSTLKDKLPNLNLIVAGEFYEDQKIYDNIIRNCGLEERVIVNNQFITDSMVGPYFNVSDAVILPYIHATQSGIGRIATYFVKPLIVTDVGSLAEQANNGATGIVAKPTSKDIAEAILQLYSSESNFKKAITKEKESNTWKGLYNHIINQCV